MAITPDLLDIETIRRTLRALPYEEAKQTAMRFLAETLGDKAVLTDWELSLQEYIEANKNSKLLFCWYTDGVGVVFTPPIITASGGCSEKGSVVRGYYPNMRLRFWNG